MISTGMTGIFSKGWVGMNLQVLNDRRISEAVNIRVSMSDIGNSGEDGLRFKKEMGYHTAVEDGIEILVIMQQKEGDTGIRRHIFYSKRKISMTDSIS